MDFFSKYDTFVAIDPFVPYNYLMKVKHREKLIDITTAILEGLLTLGEATVNSFINQKSFYKQLRNEYPSQAISDRVRSMLRSGYIEATEENGTRSIRITRKGKIRRLEKTSDVSIDGKWRFFSFDIPEDYKNKRHQLVRSIRRIGFKAVQKSLWVSPYIKADEIDLIVEELKICQFCAYLVVEKTDIEDHLHRLFPDIE